jgi:hypothetical protein
MLKSAIALTAISFILTFQAHSKETIFKEQRIGFGYYPSWRGSQNFWLNYSVNKRSQKTIYSIRGMYNFRSEKTQEVTNYAIGPCVSLKFISFFKNKLEVRPTVYLPYVTFRYEKNTYPGSLYATRYQGAALLPGLNLQTEITERIGLRYGANAGVYYAQTKEPVFEQKNGVTRYQVYSNKNLYWIMLIDFSITVKISKNYLPNQR